MEDRRHLFIVRFLFLGSFVAYGDFSNSTSILKWLFYLLFRNFKSAIFALYLQFFLLYLLELLKRMVVKENKSAI